MSLIYFEIETAFWRSQVPVSEVPSFSLFHEPTMSAFADLSHLGQAMRAGDLEQLKDQRLLIRMLE